MRGIISIFALFTRGYLIFIFPVYGSDYDVNSRHLLFYSQYVCWAFEVMKYTNSFSSVLQDKSCKLTPTKTEARSESWVEV